MFILSNDRGYATNEILKNNRKWITTDIYSAKHHKTFEGGF